MNDAFKDIDTEDLADPDVIKPIVASIIEGQAGFKGHESNVTTTGLASV